MLNTSGIVPGHSILHLLDKDGESQPTDIAQQLLNRALMQGIAMAGAIFSRDAGKLQRSFCTKTPISPFGGFGADDNPLGICAASD
jgi:hypothetical protein